MTFAKKPTKNQVRFEIVVSKGADIFYFDDNKIVNRIRMDTTRKNMILFLIVCPPLF